MPFNEDQEAELRQRGLGTDAIADPDAAGRNAYKQWAAKQQAALEAEKLRLDRLDRVLPIEYYPLDREHQPVPPPPAARVEVGPGVFKAGQAARSVGEWKIKKLNRLPEGYRYALRDPDLLAKPDKIEVNGDEPVKKAKVINLNRFLKEDAVKNRIYRVGIEVEGGWAPIPPGCVIVHDGSVFKGGAFPPGFAASNAPKNFGEIASPPIERATVKNWMKKYHPTVIDGSCGLHVHMGFKNCLYYDRLMDSPDYQETVLAYLKKWAEGEPVAKEHCIWERLEGKNIYCRKLFWPDLQAEKTGKEHDVQREGHKKGHRYTVVNYCWGLGFGTLEIRVLPMMATWGQSLRAVNTILDVTNAYLAYAAPKTLAERKANQIEIKAEVAGDLVYRDVRQFHVEKMR